MLRINEMVSQYGLAALGLLVFALSLGMGCVQPGETTTDATGVNIVESDRTGGSSTGGGTSGGGTSGGGTSGGGTSGGGTSGGGTSGGGTSGGGTSGGGDGATVALEEGVFGTSLDFIEAPGLIGPCFGNLCSETAGAGKPAGVQRATSSDPQLLVTLSGAQGDIIFDLQSRTTVLDFASGTSGGDGAFGWVPVSRPSPGPDTPASLFRFDESSGFASFGGTLTPYLPEERAFSEFSQLQQGSYLDALTAGNTLVSDEILACSDRGPRSIIFDPDTQRYDLDSDEGFAVSFDIGRGCVSIVTATAGGPVLAVSRTQGRFSDSRLYFTDRSGAATDVGVLGVDARRIRHLNAIAVVSLFGDDSLRIVSWDGVNAPTIVGDPIAVGDGPVGLGLRDAGNNTIQVVSTGFNDNTITVTTVASDGSVTGNTVYGAPAGCSQPAHAIFIDNADDVADPFVMATCFSTGNYVISKVSSLAPVPASE